MKVILTGVTGYLGEEVLRQCVAHPQITEIAAIARKDLKDEYMNNKKVTLVKTDDLGSYSDDMIEKLKGAEACIWALGTTPGKGEPGIEYVRRINVDWTIAGAETFSSKWALPDGKKFRFVYTSGVLMPDPDQLDSKLWFGEELRKTRGQADKRVLDMAVEGKLEAVVAKPAFITESLFPRLTFGMWSISRQTLAASYIDIILNGHKNGIMRNGDLNKHGAEALKKLEKQ